MAKSDYWSQMSDASLSPVERQVAHRYAELEDAAADVQRAAARLAADAADAAARWDALAKDIEAAPVPMVFSQAMSESYDKAVAKFREREQALKAVLAVQRMIDRLVD